METMRAMPCRLVVMRHGERIDDLFPEWIQKSTSTGKYQPFDLNMPRILPPLKRPIDHYEGDPILSEMGFILGQMVGRGLLINKSVPDVIYSSPALRCVQTAQAALIGMRKEDENKIRIEPALFEYSGLYPRGQPKFATPEELREANFSTDLDYKPTVTIDKIWHANETVKKYGERVQNLLKRLARTGVYSQRADGAVLMLVGHASTVDLAIGAFKDPPRNTLAQELINNGVKFPYCCTAVIDRSSGGYWEYNEAALPPISYMNFCNKINRHFALRERIST